MNALYFVVEAELLRQQGDYLAAAALYGCAAMQATTDGARKGLAERAAEMQAEWEVKQLERLYAR